MHLHTVLLTAPLGAAIANPLRYHWTDSDGGNGDDSSDNKDAAAAWGLDKIKSLVLFGDSLSDSGFADALGENGFEPLEPGTIVPESSTIPNGGRGWPSYVRQYAEEKQADGLKLYNYAIAGAVCSSEIVDIQFPELDFPMPGVLDYELPAFEADIGATIPGTSDLKFSPPLGEADTAYGIWVGHNDLGTNGFLFAQGQPGYTIADYIDCIYASLDGLYSHGARKFVLATLLPLELAPLYANETLNGQEEPPTWPQKAEYNATVVADNVRQLLTTVNAVFASRTPFELRVAQRYPGASFALFDGSKLVYDIYHNPDQYFNGTVSPNVQDSAGDCEINEFGQLDCEMVGDTVDNMDAFMWFDGLHLTEQAHRVIGKEYLKMLDGESEFATYF